MTKVGSDIAKIAIFVDQVKSKQTSLIGGLIDHQITRKGLNKQIFPTRKWEKIPVPTRRRLDERTINMDLQLALAVRVPMWLSYNPEGVAGKRVAKKSQYHID